MAIKTKPNVKLKDPNKNQALGKGLDAIFQQSSKNQNVTDEKQLSSSSNYRMISIAKLYPNSDQPRKLFSDEPLLQLAESIKQHGVIQPILVRPIENSDNFQIIAGERRWRASQKAGVHEVPIIIQNTDDKNTLQVAIVENLQREDLVPFEEARAYKKLTEEYNYSQEEISSIVGKSRSHIANIMRILSLSDKIEEEASQVNLSAGHLRCLVGLDETKALSLINSITKNNLNVRQTEKHVQKLKSNYLKPKLPSNKPVDLIDLEYTLSKIIGLEVSINYKKDQASYMKINFTKLAELDSLMDKIMNIPADENNNISTLSDEEQE